jgi:low affinity Fe/Cu permease
VAAVVSHRIAEEARGHTDPRLTTDCGLTTADWRLSLVFALHRSAAATMAHRRPRATKLERISEAVTRWTGSTPALFTAVGIVIGWAAIGPAFHFSDTWQLVINTGTTIVTFLMVFLIQRSQNKESLAIHLKLNEIVAALEGASNRLIDADQLSEQELTQLQRHYGELARLAKQAGDVTESHSVEEARERHSTKRRRTGRRSA